MKRATSATVCSNDAPASRDRARASADVNRWVAMIDAELRSEEDTHAPSEESVTVTLEFGRTSIDIAAQPLQAGDSLRLDQRADEPLDVVVDGRSIARGELVQVDGQLGVRIVELLMLAFVWLAIGVGPSFADERTQERSSTILFGEDSESLETPFGTVRRSRTGLESEAPSVISTKINDAPPKSDVTPLPPRSDAATRDANRPHGSAAPNWSATVWPLMIVVGLIVVGARWLKSRTPSASRGLPGEVFEVLGRKVIDPRTSVMLARCGSRLLLLSQSPHGLQTLAEITDPVEIDCLAGLCHATPRDQTLVETFRSLLRKPSGSKPTSPPAQTPAVTHRLDERLAARLPLPRSVSASTSEVRS